MSIPLKLGPSECVSEASLGRGFLNILASTSRQWNPGDEFILAGVRNLVEPLISQPMSWAIWNRNPDLFVDRWNQPIFRPTILSNCAVEPTLDVYDMVVLAGTPEWFGPVVERIYRELLRFPHVPLVALGLGGCGPGFRFTPLELEVFNRPNTLVICRNPSLVEDMNAQLSTPKAQLLPCPAFFCSADLTPRSEASFAATIPAVGVQGDSVENQSLPTAALKLLRDRFVTPEFAPRVTYVAHYIEEYLSFSRGAAKNRIFYSYEQADYPRFFRGAARQLLTTRLHGAIAALSCGTPSRLIDFGSARVNDACLPFGTLLESLPAESAGRWLQDQDTSPKRLAEESNALMTLKRETLQKYHQTLAPFFQRCLPESSRAVVASGNGLSGGNSVSTSSIVGTECQVNG